MVEVNKIEAIIINMEKFFSSVIKKSNLEDDVENASYGITIVGLIKKNITEYKKSPTNKKLKQIDAALVSVTRGVEYFENYNDNERFRNICRNIPSLKKHIKW